MSEAHIQDLADEVLLLIFQYLPDQALLSARCVCAQWKAVAEDPSLLYEYQSQSICISQYKLNTKREKRSILSAQPLACLRLGTTCIWQINLDR